MQTPRPGCRTWTCFSTSTIIRYRSSASIRKITGEKLSVEVPSCLGVVYLTVAVLALVFERKMFQRVNGHNDLLEWHSWAAKLAKLDICPATWATPTGFLSMKTM